MQSLVILTLLALGQARTETYSEAQRRAIKEGKPFVVFVGVAGKSLDNAVATKLSSVDGYPAKCVIVSDMRGYWKATLPATATDSDIAAAVRGESRTAIPFRGRKGEVDVLPDVESDPPQLAALLKGMERYATAKNTQTTFRRWSGYITPSNRLELPNKWNVPGHLDGVEGWSSQLYRRPNVLANEFLVRQDPSDGSSAVTWGRSYENGALFVDVLRNSNGRMFEVRVAEKGGGRFDRYVAFSNPDARPVGYTRPKSADCRACHDAAGRSEYGGSANPGADTVISEPMRATEYGGSVQGGYGTRL